MPSNEEVIRAVSSLKVRSTELSSRFSASAQNLNSSLNQISALVRGSNTGMQAAQALSVACQSLRNAAASIQTLSRACDDCAKSLSK